MSVRSLIAMCICAGLLTGVLIARHAGAQKAPAAADSEPAAPPTSFLDPRVIAEIVKNCRFDVRRDRPDWPGTTNDDIRQLPLLECASRISQSCAVDPCYDDDQDSGCRAGCDKTCFGCIATCGNRCESCKAHCTNDACRLGCAKQCAGCQQGCIRLLDRCSSGKCSDEYDACKQRIRDAWTRNKCDSICERISSSCQKKCKDNKECTASCYEAARSAHENSKAASKCQLEGCNIEGLR